MHTQTHAHARTHAYMHGTRTDAPTSSPTLAHPGAQEEDPWCEEKLELLAATGLGSAHLMTEDLGTEVGRPRLGSARSISYVIRDTDQSDRTDDPDSSVMFRTSQGYH
jgi:hypothetical protein